AEPLCQVVRQRAAQVCANAGLEIEHVRKSHIRKEELVQRVLATRGDAPGLVHVISAMEACPSYRPWHDKASGKTYLRGDTGKCLHYYFYFIDEELGLCYVRVPTWLPCRLQVYFNGHSWLASLLRKRKVDFQLIDNAFVDVADWGRAQQIANELEIKRLHRRLDEMARRFCPIHQDFGVAYHWSVDQCEYATDIVFRRQADLAAIYGNLIRTAIHTVKPDNIATFLGRKLNAQYEGEMGNRFNIRIEGTRIKHTMGPVSLKLYDKFGLILRIETTVNDLTFFKHYREVEHRDGTKETTWASMQKTIYSLPALREILEAANRRYLEFLSAIEDPRNGRDKLDKLSQSVLNEGRSYPGFNLFDADDEALFSTIARGEFNIGGMQNKTLRRFLPDKTSGQMSRLLKRLRVHGLIKKVGHTYKYYLTRFGKTVITTGLKLRELVIIPQLATAMAV
ncbi:MAG: MarR family transcriptional regulator, partial [Candidatus Nanopelagicales bacterium]